MLTKAQTLSTLMHVTFKANNIPSTSTFMIKNGDLRKRSIRKVLKTEVLKNVYVTANLHVTLSHRTRVSSLFLSPEEWGAAISIADSVQACAVLRKYGRVKLGDKYGCFR